MVKDIEITETGDPGMSWAGKKIKIHSPKGGAKLWEGLSPEGYVALVSHESLHGAVSKVYGTGPPSNEPYRERKDYAAQVGLHDPSLVSGTKEEQEQAWQQMEEDVKAGRLGGRLEEKYAGHPEGLEQNLSNMIERKCSNCGDQPDHMHGKHGCCGRQGCHMKITLAHTAYGEDSVSRLMRKNWPSLRGLI